MIMDTNNSESSSFRNKPLTPQQQRQQYYQPTEVLPSAHSCPSSSSSTSNNTPPPYYPAYAPPGHAGNLTLYQRRMLEQFKYHVYEWERREQQTHKIIEGRETEDSFLLRFLRASQWDIQQAVPLYIESHKWRKEFQGIGAENITADMVRNQIRQGKTFVHGFDKVGRPVVYVRARLHDKNDPRDEMERFTVYIFEKVRRLLNPAVDSGLVVFDMTGFGLKNMDHQFTKFMIDVFTCKYPDSLGMALVVEAPLIFSTCWKVIKPWINPAMTDRIKFVQKSEVKNYIDPNNLLVEFGGNDPWQYCVESE